MAKKYNFYNIPNNKIVCIGRYDGHIIRRVAICAEGDDFNYEKGCALAQLRVESEIIRRRIRSVEQALEECEQKTSEFNKRYNSFLTRYDSLQEDYIEIQDKLDKLLDTM